MSDLLTRLRWHPHLVVDDNWYSCPAAGEDAPGWARDQGVTACNCYRPLMQEAADRIEALEAEVERLSNQLATEAMRADAYMRERDELEARIPDPDDLRLALGNLGGPLDPRNNADWWAAADRLRTILPTTTKPLDKRGWMNEPNSLARLHEGIGTRATLPTTKEES